MTRKNTTSTFWSARMGLGEWTPEDKAEIEARTKELLAKRLAVPKRIANVTSKRHSTAIYRCHVGSVRVGRTGRHE